MMMMSVMMVMVMSVSSLGVVDGAILFVTMLAGGFKLQGSMGNTVLGKFFAYGFLNMVRVSLGYYVQRCIIAVSVHTPNVYVVNILHTIDMQKMLANFVYVDAVRRFFKKQIDDFFEVFNSIDKDEDRYANRH